MSPPTAGPAPGSGGTTRSAPAGAVRDRVAAAFRWHLRIFVGVNLALNLINAATGGHWWAFWPLLLTAMALAVHYLIGKAAAVDEHWVARRTEELNLKSYDRSHIENLKSRYGDDKPPDRRR